MFAKVSMKNLPVCCETYHRSFLVCFLEDSIYHHVKKSLLEDQRVWVVFIEAFSNVEVSSLTNQKRIVLTLHRGEPFTEWTRHEYHGELNDNVYCFLVCKEWSGELSADWILWEHLNKSIPPVPDAAIDSMKVFDTTPDAVEHSTN